MIVKTVQMLPHTISYPKGGNLQELSEDPGTIRGQARQKNSTDNCFF